MANIVLIIYEVVGAWFQYNNAGTMAEKEVDFANTIQFTPQETVLEIQGSGKTKRIYLSGGVEIELTADSWPTEVMDLLTDSASVTTVDGVLERRFFGKPSQSGTLVGIRTRLMGVDDLTGTKYYVDATVPRATAGFLTPPSGKFQDKSPMTLKLSGEPTLVDVAGTAIEGLTGTEKITWYQDLVGIA